MAGKVLMLDVLFDTVVFAVFCSFENLFFWSPPRPVNNGSAANSDDLVNGLDVS